MGRQIIKQPDGQYAIWSTIVDNFIVIDATPDEIIEIFVDEERERIVAKVDSVVSQLNEGGKPYLQFTMSWNEAVEKHKGIYGELISLESLRKESV